MKASILTVTNKGTTNHEVETTTREELLGEMKAKYHNEPERIGEYTFRVVGEPDKAVFVIFRPEQK